MTTGFDREQDVLANGFTPFPEDRAEVYRQAGYWQGKALDSILREGAQRWPDKPAVVDATGKVVDTCAILRTCEVRFPAM
nr:hypothetical protein [Streptomyces sp. DSM 41633]